MDGQRREPHARQERLIGFGAPVASAEGHPLRIRDIGPNDAGEVLTLQRAAFVQEAILYDSLASPTPFTRSTNAASSTATSSPPTS